MKRCTLKTLPVLLIQLLVVSPQLSGTEILDAIENETSGTLKKCYIALGLCEMPHVEY